VVTYVKSIEISVKKESPYWMELAGHGVFMMQGKSLSLNPTILPDTASNKNLIWTSDNTGVAVVSGNGVVTAVGSGIAIITATAADNGGKKKTFYVYSSTLSKEDCKYIAHRGLSEFAPENSLAAFGLALRSNYDSLELDVWATTDQEFVVSHNQSLLNACGVDVNVTDMTLAQATSYRIINGNGVESYPSECIPSLNQVLDLAQIYPGRNISIELKQVFSKEMLEKLLEDIKQRDLQDRVKLITFYRANLSTIRSLEEFGGDEIALEYLVSSPREEALDICEKYHADYGVKYTGLTQEQVKKIHDLGLKVNVWTVSDYLDAYHMVHTMKVDYLTTDYQFFQ
jgi:glycerophosphoryl diester phosphodiesterase